MKADCILDYSILSVERGRTLNLLIKLVAPPVKAKPTSKPVQLCLVLDCSGSMKGDKLDKTKEAAKLIFSRLLPDDIVSLVAFSSNVKTLILPQKVISKKQLFSAVDRLEAGGRTNLSGGLLKGIEHLSTPAPKGTIKRILLLTDGVANEGIITAPKLVNIVKNTKDRSDIITTTLGFGLDFNEDLLIGMAQAATGNFYYIERSDDAPKAFADELHGIQQLVAQNISLKIDWDNRVEHAKQITEHPDLRSGESLFIELGDAVADEQKHVLVQLELPEIKSLGECEVAKVEVKFTELTEESAQINSLSQKVMVNIVDAANSADKQPQMEVLQELALQESAQTRKEVLADTSALVSATNFKKCSEAAKKLQAAAEKLLALSESAKSAEIKAEIKQLLFEAEKLKDIADNKVKNADSETKTIRKMMATNTMKIATGQLKKLKPKDPEDG